MFFKGSRYQPVPTLTRTDSAGREVVYKGIRFIPPTPPRFGHELSQSDRLDLVSYRYFRDPQLFWRICDANRALAPQALLDTVGRRLVIPLPDGIPGATLV